MTKVVMLGGNGYIGRTVASHWLQRDPEVELIVLSRSGRNQLTSSRIHNQVVDVTDQAAVLAATPADVDYLIDFVGAPEKDPVAFEKLNQQPARVMRAVAEARGAKAMGFVQGQLGDKAFVTGKAQIAADLAQSPVPLAVVNPTLVIGNGRSDQLTKLVPLLKFLGLFSRRFKPVDVNQVAEELIGKLVAAGEN